MVKEKTEKNTLVLSVRDRLVVTSLFPDKGSIMDQLTMRDIRDKVDFSKEDREKYEIKMDEATGIVRWSQEANDMTFPVQLSSPEIDFLKKRVKELDDQRQVSASQLELFLKIRDLDL